YNKLDTAAQSRAFIVPTSIKNATRWYRRNVHRARCARKRNEAVTQERSSSPLQEKLDRGGHASAFTVPTSGEIGWSWSRKSVHRSHFMRNWIEVVTSSRSTFPLSEKMDVGGNV